MLFPGPSRDTGKCAAVRIILSLLKVLCLVARVIYESVLIVLDLRPVLSKHELLYIIIARDKSSVDTAL